MLFRRTRQEHHSHPSLLDSPCGPRSPAPMDFCSSVQMLTETTDGVKPSVLFQVRRPLQTRLVLLMGLPLTRSPTSSRPLGLETKLIPAAARPMPRRPRFPGSAGISRSLTTPVSHPSISSLGSPQDLFPWQYPEMLSPPQQACKIHRKPKK